MEFYREFKAFTEFPNGSTKQPVQVCLWAFPVLSLLPVGRMACMKVPHIKMVSQPPPVWTLEKPFPPMGYSSLDSVKMRGATAGRRKGVSSLAS